jgi:D-glycero-alpha-D-manno-heptose 1-phosphate guanylyltransferase
MSDNPSRPRPHPRNRVKIEDENENEDEDEMKKLSPEQISAVVLAGGLGKRIQHLLPDTPKPMAPVNGRPFLEWVIRYLAAQKIRRVILSTGHRTEAIEEYFRSQPVNNMRVTWVAETKPLGTAGGFLNAILGANETPEAWLVLNGDSLAPAPLADFVQSVCGEKVEAAILGVKVPDASRFGTVLQNEAGDLTGFKEKKPGAGLINAGVYLFRPSAIEMFQDKSPLSFETDVFPALIACGVRLKVCVTDAPFLDIGTPESLPLAEDFIRRHQKFFEQ